MSHIFQTRHLPAVLSRYLSKQVFKRPKAWDVAKETGANLTHVITVSPHGPPIIMGRFHFDFGGCTPFISGVS